MLESKRTRIRRITVSALEKSTYITVADYLLDENDRVDGTKYEYINGQVYAMAGASRNHNRVAGNLFLNLGLHLKNSDCEVFQSDMKVGIKTLNEERFYYPDIQVTCEDEMDKYYNRFPCLIIEVLSDSTARTDRTEKLAAYTSIPSVKEYVLCSQDAPAIEVYRRRNEWQRAQYQGGETLLLESISLELNVAELYAFLS